MKTIKLIIILTVILFSCKNVETNIDHSNSDKTDFELTDCKIIPIKITRSQSIVVSTFAIGMVTKLMNISLTPSSFTILN